MAVRIPTYEDRLNPSGFANPQARGVEVSTAMGQAMQNIGQAGASFASQEMGLLKQKEDADAIVDAGQRYSNAALHWSGYIDESSKSMTPETANGFTPKVLGEFDAYTKETLDGIPNERARRWAAEHFTTLRTRLGENALRIEAATNVADRDNKLESTFQNLARLASSDPSQYEIGRTILMSTIANAGYDPVVRNDRAKTYLERYAEAAFTGASARNPQAAKDIIDATSGIGPAAAASPVVTTTNVPNPDELSITTQPASVDAVWNKLETRESGGRQSAVSKKGAIGVAQIMPDTGPEAAKLAGLPWDPERLKNDANYNRALGKAYLQKQLDDFGDMDKALAAYNGGPGALRKALKKAGDGGDWLSYMPQETQDYVAALGGGGKPTTTATAAPATATAAPAAPATPRELDPTLQRIAADININRLPAFANHAQSELNRAQATVRAQIESAEGDHISQWMNGKPVQNPLTENQYVQAFGPEIGRQRFANYVQTQILGSDINAMKLATPQELQALVNKNAPDPNKPGFELANKRYQMAVQAAAAVQKARQDDPMLYAVQNQIGGVQPIDWNNADASALELGRRAGVAATMRQTYGAQTLQLLTKDEASRLSAGFNNMGAAQKLAYLGTMVRSVPQPDAQQAIIQQIAPDSPVTAVAANLVTMAKGPAYERGMWWWKRTEEYQPLAVATMVLRGEEILNPSKAASKENGRPTNMVMPKEQDFRASFINKVGEAFVNQERSLDIAYQAVKAYYAAASVQAGDYSAEGVDSKRMKTAIEAVIGGMSDVNGYGQVRLPWGMPESDFKDASKGAFDAKMKELGLTGPDANFELYGLENAGAGYLVRRGTGYMTDKTGQPVYLTLSAANLPAMASGTIAPAPAVTTKPNTSAPKTK